MKKEIYFFTLFLFFPVGILFQGPFLSFPDDIESNQESFLNLNNLAGADDIDFIDNLKNSGEKIEGIIIQLPSPSWAEYSSIEVEGERLELEEYINMLTEEHEDFISTVGYSPTREYFTAFNGIAFRSDNDQMLHEIVSAMPSTEGYKVWPLRVSRINLVDSVPLIGATTFWNLTNNTQGQGVSVAVLDTGVDYTHPAFGSCTNLSNCSKFRGGFDFAYNDSDPMDDNGHGTHVSSTVAGIASPNSSNGVAPGAQLGALKVCFNNALCYQDDIIEAIEYAIDPNGDLNFNDKYDIISMSLGGSGTPDDPTSQAVDNANDIGSLVVVASGNFWSGSTYGDLTCAACARKAFTVGATTKQDTVAYFSGKGPIFYNGEQISKPNIVAPGVNICAARWGNAYSQFNTNCFSGNNINVAIMGTSMAAPHVSGAAALVKSLYPSWTVDEIKASLTQTAKNIGLDIYQQGSGRLEVSKINSLEALIVPSNFEVGLLNNTIGAKNISFTIKNIDQSPIYFLIENISVKNIETNLSYIISTGAWNVNMSSGSSLNATLTLNVSSLPLGTYSGITLIKLYNLTNLSQAHHNLSVPIGFSKLNEFRIMVVGTPSSGSSTYYNHYNEFLIQQANGENKKYYYYEYGPNNQYNYTIYTKFNDADLIYRMLELSNYPSYNQTNINYFFTRINSSNLSISFYENQSQHIQQNWANISASKGLEPIGFLTTAYTGFGTNISNLLYFIYPQLSNSFTPEFGVYSSGNLIRSDYNLDFGINSVDIGYVLNNTKNYMILPSTVSYPFSNLNLTLSLQDINFTNITIKNGLISQYNGAVYFGIGNYHLNSPYYPDTLLGKISLPRNGLFYYLNNGCHSCHYHFKSYIWNGPSSGENALFWQEYFDSKDAKSVYETPGQKLTNLSFYENFDLKLNNSYCLNYTSQTSYYCNDTLLHGKISDRTDGGIRYATEFISGNLSIRSPDGHWTSIFSKDKNNLYFGGWGSFMIDCTNIQLSTPAVLRNSSRFCANGTYILNWNVTNFSSGHALSKTFSVRYDNNTFII